MHELVVKLMLMTNISSICR